MNEIKDFQNEERKRLSKKEIQVLAQDSEIPWLYQATDQPTYQALANLCSSIPAAMLDTATNVLL